MSSEGGIFIKTLKFCYTLKAEYSDTISRHDFSVMFIPHDSARQKIDEVVTDIADCVNCRMSTDSFGNKKMYGKISEPHTSFCVKISGIARAGLDIYEEYTPLCSGGSVFRVQSPLTVPGKNLAAYRQGLELSAFDGAYEKALHVMHTLHFTFEYKKGLTGVGTTAEEAISSGGGVCQDFAHIMISLLRTEKIPSRYVVGMIPGEGVSHAWVEALCNGYWYGFDPTNNKLVNDEYIRVSCGRDAADCPIIRGSFRGSAVQSQHEEAVVSQLA